MINLWLRFLKNRNIKRNSSSPYPAYIHRGFDGVKKTRSKNLTLRHPLNMMKHYIFPLTKESITPCMTEKCTESLPNFLIFYGKVHSRGTELICEFFGTLVDDFLLKYKSKV
jgi:hypothetical protein